MNAIRKIARLVIREMGRSVGRQDTVASILAEFVRTGSVDDSILGGSIPTDE